MATNTPTPAHEAVAAALAALAPDLQGASAPTADDDRPGRLASNPDEVRAPVTVPAAALDRLDAAMSRHLDGDPEAGLETAVRDLMNAAHGTAHLRHDTDTAEAALAELRADASVADDLDGGA